MIADDKKEEAMTEIPIDEKKEEEAKTEILIDDTEKAEPKKTEDLAHALFWEGFLDKIVDGIMDSFGWANANLVQQAMTITVAATIKLEGGQIGTLWGITAVFFLITLAGGTWGLRCFTGCANCCCPNPPEETRERSQSKMDLGAQMAGSTCLSILLTIYDIFFIRTLPIVTAGSFAGAASKSFDELGKDNAAIKNMSVWIFAIFMTILVLQFLSCYTGCMSEDEMEQGAEVDEYGNRKVDRSENASRKYCFKLTQVILQVSLGLSYRMAIQDVFNAIFTDAGAKIAANWIYTAIITLFTVFVLTTTDRFGCCVPSKPGLPFQLGSRSRTLLTDTMGGAVRLNVAFAWLDSILASLAPLSGEDKVVATLVYMLIAYLIFIVTDYLVQKHLLTLFDKLNSGVFSAAGAVQRKISLPANDDKRGPENVDEEAGNTAQYCGDFCKQTLLIISASMIVVSGNSVAPFVEALVMRLNDIDNIKDLTEPGGLWVAVLLSLSFCAAVASWLGCCVKSAKSATQLLVKTPASGVRKMSDLGSGNSEEIELQTKDEVDESMQNPVTE